MVKVLDTIVLLWNCKRSNLLELSDLLVCYTVLQLWLINWFVGVVCNYEKRTRRTRTTVLARLKMTQENGQKMWRYHQQDEIE
jgi:hypothetical protein